MLGNCSIAFTQSLAPKQSPTTFFTLINSQIKAITIINKDLKKIVNESQKDSAGKSSAKLKLKKAKKKNIKNDTDKKLAQSIITTKTLKKSLIKRLEQWQAMGYISIQDIDIKIPVNSLLEQHKNKPILTKFDCKLMDRIQEKEKEKNPFSDTEIKRIETLEREGFIKIENDNLYSTDHFILTKRTLIERGLLDDRDRKMLSFRDVLFIIHSF